MVVKPFVHQPLGMVLQQLKHHHRTLIMFTEIRLLHILQELAELSNTII